MLERYRQKIDMIDIKILTLLAKRIEIVKNIGLYKQQNNIPMYQPERYKELLAKLKKYGKELGLCSDFIENIGNVIHKESLKIQK